MKEEMVKCPICQRKTNSSFVCNDCLKVTESFHKWMESLKKDRKKMTDQGRMVALKSILTRVGEVGQKTLREWGTK